MNIVIYPERMARTHELARASPPYERVQNSLRYSFNNLFVIFPLISNGQTDKKLRSQPIKMNSFKVGAIIETDARPTSN